METIIIIILALALAVLAVLYIQLRADYKELDDAFDENAEKGNAIKNENKRLTAKLDQLSKDYKALDEKYNRYHRKQGKDGRFVKKGGEV